MNEKDYSLTTNAENRLASWRSSKIIPLRHTVHDISPDKNTRAVISHSLSKDGRYLFSGGLNQLLIQWDLKTGPEFKH